MKIIIFFFLVLNIIIKILSQNCKIEVPSSVMSQKLDNIICLGDSGFAYSNFATFSNGSLVIESSKDAGTDERIFYGITSDGKPLFEKNSNYFLSLNVGDNYHRKESENFIITINDETKSEYLISIGNNEKLEIYNLETKTVIYKRTTDSFISGVLNQMDSMVQTAINYFDGTNYFTYHVYLNSLGYLVINKIKFKSTSEYSFDKSALLNDINGKVASCFITENKYILCIVIKKISAIKSNIYVYAFGVDLGNSIYNTQLDDYGMVPDSNSRYPYFIKAIHLEEEIGAFAFYRSENYNMIKHLIIVIKEFNINSLSDYINKIELDKYETEINCLLNDMIKINKNKICVFTTSDIAKDVMYIILINIYDSTKTAIRYYTFNIKSLYNFSFYSNMRANLYNNYISFVFSFSYNNNHYPGLIFFNYPNGTDVSIDVISKMFDLNSEIDNMIISLKNQVKIDNNIFGLEYSQIIIDKITDCSSIIFASSLNESTSIIEGYNMAETEDIIVKKFPLEKTECKISYYYIITEPSFEKFNLYATEKVFDSNYTEDFFETDNYQSRLLYYNLVLSQTLTENCPIDNYCSLCKQSKEDFCVVCKYKYTIINSTDGFYKCCSPFGVNTINTEENEATEILTEKLTEMPIHKLTQTLIEEPTDKNEQQTERPIEKPSEQPTEMHTKKPIEQPTEKPTEKSTEKSTEKTSENQTEKGSEQPTEKPTKKPNEMMIEKSSEEPTEKPTEQPTEQISEQPTENPTEKITEKPTEKATEKPSEKQTEQSTEMPTEQSTEKPTEKTTQKPNEKPTESSREKSTEKNEEKSEGIKISSEDIYDNNDKVIVDTVINDYFSVESMTKTITLIDESKNLGESQQNESYIFEIINKQCKSGKLNSTQIFEVYQLMKSMFLSESNGEKSTIVPTENVVYQISTFEFQKNDENPNISSIDLGKCEQKLKTEYKIFANESLIIFKIDYKDSDTKQTYIHYEVYNPKNLSYPLNLSICNDIKIVVKTPLNLDDNSIKLYENLKSAGYDVFDSSDKFYTDVCSVYTTENGTDMLIEDRKNEIYYAIGNITMCQNGCSFELYNVTTKKSICSCEPQITNDNIENLNEDKFSPKILGKEFLKTIKNSNFMVLTCYKIAIDTKELFKNIGRIIMTLFFFFYLVCLFAYIFKERKKIDTFISLIIKNKHENFLSINDNTYNSDNKKKINKEKEKKIKKYKRNNNNNSKDKKKDKKNNIIVFSYPPKKGNGKNRKKKLNHTSNKNSELNTISLLDNKNKLNKININIFPMKISKEVYFEKNENKIKENINNYITYNKLNDQELNTLEYKEAILVDKRNYLQYYWSLLKKKQLILFTLIPADDYNLFSLKFALFILSFALYFSINGFFFNDSTMRKINKSGGKFDFLLQIPQIIYSSIISAVINLILKNLSLSENNLLKLKAENDIKSSQDKSVSIKRCIIIKFIIFFIISNLLLLFFWYFISCFCGVYTNTQIALFKDTIISFTFSMLYPFGINLIPGIFRLSALKDKNSPYLYKLSMFIAII